MARIIGANSTAVKQQNMEAVKMILYQQAPLSRADIAARLGLTPSTITNITAELIAQGYVEEVASETDEPARGAGRKPVLIDLKRDCFTVLGITLGRDSTRLCLCDMRGGILTQATYETMSDDYSVMLHQLQGILSITRQEHPELWNKLLGIGISIPGVVNAHRGQVKNHGEERLSWRNQPLTEEISRFTGLPVRLENNVKARSTAIQLFWPALLEGEKIFALCYVSFGIACPFLLDNQLFRGESSAAGEIGKMILQPDAAEDPGFAPPGSLEALSSVLAILKECREQIAAGADTMLRELCPDPDALSLSQVLEAQNRGDPTVCRVLDQAMFYVGIALANLVDIINPRLILLSGPVFVNPQNADTVERALRAHAFLPDEEPLRVVPVDMGEYAGAIGAAACCIDKYFLRS
ncbi:MAG: ROK family transcriptional regulator [Clostridia bacterium]|nr:ROK family transcriptional regulator [Clostridia bacterium]